MMTGKKMFLVVMIGVVPHLCFAWGLLGHRVVGGIAEQYLTPAARAGIRKILGNESLAMASNWADFIKSDRQYDYLGPWHYVNVEAGMDRAEVMAFLKRDTATDLYTRLNFVIRELKNKSLPQQKKVFYLKLLIHLVGDAHQPMHAGRPGDRGGNGVKVYWFNDPTNLHRVWDEQLIEFQQLSYTEYVAAINFGPAENLSAWRKQPINEWIYESYEAAERIYRDTKAEDKLTYSYNFRYQETLNRQLLKGGLRLAETLNKLFGGAG